MVLCRKHISQYARHGKFLNKTIYDKNDYILHSDYAEIVLLDKNGNLVDTCLIDIDDVDSCKKI